MGSGDVSAFATFAPTPNAALKGAGDALVTDADIQDEKNKIKSENDARSGKFAAGTLGAISYVVNGMTEMPGRKFAILFSDGFQLTAKDGLGGIVTSDLLEPLRRGIDLANRSSVVVYTMDPRGLQPMSLTAADYTRNLNPAAINSRIAERRGTLNDAQACLSFLAEATGGFTIKNQNDLNLGLDRILDDQSYYLVGYEPHTESFDPATRKFNSISVKISRKDTDVRYRSGFFNVADTKRAPVADNLTPVQLLEKTLYSPFAANEISMRLTTLFGLDATNMAFVRLLLHSDGAKLKFTDEPNGQKKAIFSVLAASFGGNGAPIDQLGKTYTLAIPAALYDKVLTDGIVYHFKFPVKNPGAYQFRVAIRDTGGGSLGSASQFIEVPDLKNGRLTLSTPMIENLTVEEYKQTFDLMAPLVQTNPMSATALRRAKTGSVIRWGVEIYNAKVNDAKLPDLKTRVRVFREGKLIMEGQPKSFDLAGQTDLEHLKAFGAISIGTEMEPGDYVLQVIVTDGLSKAKNQTATQYVPFEVVGR